MNRDSIADASAAARVASRPAADDWVDPEVEVLAPCWELLSSPQPAAAIAAAARTAKARPILPRT
jgi:hypothetical protein